MCGCESRKSSARRAWKCADVPADCEPFSGSAALADGRLTRHQLRTRFRAIYPDVYIKKDSEPSLQDRVRAAWLWSARKAVVAGLSAAAVHGSKWVAENSPVELIHPNPRAPRGVVTRRARLAVGEVASVNGLLVTTAARTAFDLGRRGDLRVAVARLDALFRATGVTVADVVAISACHPRTRGLRQLESALELVDRGAESPKETYLRLTLIRAGFPSPQTQIPVYGDGGEILAYLDMGWPSLLVAVEYDGDHHRTDRRQYVRDIRRLELLEQLGWLVVRVVAEDHPSDVVRRVRHAIALRESAVR